MRTKLLICILLLAPALVSAQTGTAAMEKEMSRSSYDPAARTGSRGGQKSAVESTLQRINPQNKDYGQVVEAGRIAVIEETVENVYWWSILGLAAIVILCLACICWLVRERQVRLNISADIVAQLYNSHVVSRTKAFDAIDRHNKLADRYNAKCEELAVALSATAEKERRRAKRREIDTASKLAEDPPTGEETAIHVPSGRSGGETVDEENADDGKIVDEDSEKEVTRLSELVRTLQAQSKAQNQKISNLRGQLNRAHDQYKLQLQPPRQG